MAVSDSISKLGEIFSAEPDETRLVKARRTLQIIRNQGIDPGQAKCLEIGTGSGIMSALFNEYFDDFISVDKFDLRKKTKAEYDFRIMNSEALAFPDAAFDVVIFSHVYQYLPEKTATLKEINRVLNTAGICYFSTSNRFALLEPHYHLPLLGYFPRMLASSYLKLFSGKYTEYDIFSDSYRRLRKKLDREFAVSDITLNLIKHYRQYGFSEIPAMKFVAKIPMPLLKLIKSSIMTNWILILRKKQ